MPLPSRTVARHRTGNRRALSQNFLTNPATAAELVRLSRVGPDNFTIEIGAGSGMVTEPLARVAGRLIAYELDPAYADRLALRFRDSPHVHCVNRDFLATSPPRQDFDVVASIPFNSSAAILRWCLNAEHVNSATLLTQLEFARKHTGDYDRWSRTTVTWWPLFDWRLCARVDRHQFDPVPRVDAAILRLARRHEPLLPHRALPDYRWLVEVGFGGRGGSLYASLHRHFSATELSTAFAGTGLDRRVVVGHVTPWQWITVFERLWRL
jgi:23S rRNA (adenine-N6)-dimethyltransferase